MAFRVKRVYEPPVGDDGYRVLVDRLWPRGVSKQRAELDEWMKEIAPSAELRVWFDHGAERFDEFGERYRAELDGNAAVTKLRELGKAQPTVTLLYGAKDAEINHAVVLASYLG